MFNISSDFFSDIRELYNNSKYKELIISIDSLEDKLFDYSNFNQLVFRFYYLQSLLKVGEVKKGIEFTDECQRHFSEINMDLFEKLIYYLILIIGFSYDKTLDGAMIWYSKSQALVTKNLTELLNSKDNYWYYCYLAYTANLNMKEKKFSVAFDNLKQINNHYKENTGLNTSEVLLLSWSNTLIGLIHKQTNYAELAVIDFRKSLEWGIKAKNVEYTRSAYLYLALTYEELGKEYIAIEIVEELIEQLEKTFANDEFSLSSAYNLIGNIYGRIGEFDLAKDNYYQAYNVIRDDNLIKRIESFYLNNLGVLSFKIGEHDEAMAFFHQALALAQQKEDPRELAYYYANLGEVYLAKNQLENALKYELKAIYYLNIIGNDDLLVETNFDLVRISLEQKETQRAERYIQELQKIAVNSNKFSHAIKYKLCEAFLLKEEQKVSEAKEIFLQVLAHENLAYDSKIIALTEIAELLLASKLELARDDYNELQIISQKLFYLAKEKNSLPVVSTVAIFYTRILLIGAEYDNALTVLSEVLELCYQKNAIYFKNKIQNEFKKVHERSQGASNYEILKIEDPLDILNHLRELQRFMLAFKS